MSHNRKYLQHLLPLLQDFLHRELRLIIHPNKIELKTIASGIDYLGWMHFAHHRVLRTVTKRRMFSTIKQYPSKNIIASYKGLLKHGDTQKLNDYINEFID